MRTRLLGGWLLLLGAIVAPVQAAKLALPPEAPAILKKIYGFDLDGAIGDARTLQQAQPEHPLGYMLEAEALWWRIWCLASEYKYGMVDVHHRAKLATDQPYLDLVARVTALADRQLKQQDTAEMQFYSGMGDAMAARLYGLRSESRNSARAGVRGREKLLRAQALDRELTDADLGLGLYNYYVDTLGSIARTLRFLMGIPGGSKSEGIRLLEKDIADGQLTADAARFYLALNLHRYDQQYEKALLAIGPLVEKYPTNPLFWFSQGDLYGKLGRTDQARAAYKIASELPLLDGECQAQVRKLAKLALAAQASGAGRD